MTVATPKRKWRPRFSLRSLVLLVLLIPSAFGLWWRWEPWAAGRAFKTKDSPMASWLSPDTRRLMIEYDPARPERTDTSQIQIFDSWTGEQLGSIEFDSTPFLFWGVRLFTKDEDQEIRTWVSKNRSNLDHYDGILAIYSAASRLVVTVDTEGNLMVLKSHSAPEGVVLENSQSPFKKLIFSANGQRILGALSDQAAGTEITRVWNSKTGKLLHEIKGALLDFTSDLRKVLVERDDYSVWNALTGTRLSVIPRDTSSSYEQAFLSCDGRLVRLVGERTRVLDAENGKRICEGGASSFPWFFPTGDRILLSDDKQIKLIDAGCGQVLDVVDDSDEICHAFFSDNGMCFVTTNRNRRGLRLFDTREGKLRIVADFSDYDSPSFSPDSRRVAAYRVIHRNGSNFLDTSIGISRIWDTETGEELATLPGNLINFSPDGERMLTSGHKEQKLWHRRRPEWWWGIFWLWETWATTIFGGMLVLSLVQDGRERFFIPSSVAAGFAGS